MNNEHITFRETYTVYEHISEFSYDGDFCMRTQKYALYNVNFQQFFFNGH